jgi:hypothetical protein
MLSLFLTLYPQSKRQICSPTDKFDDMRMLSKQKTARRMATLCWPSTCSLAISVNTLSRLLLRSKVSRMRQGEAPYMFRYMKDHWKVVIGQARLGR